MSVASFVSQPFSPAERATITCWIGYWVGLRAGLVAVEKWKLCVVSCISLWSPHSSYTDCTTER